jgi:hypothetical protein
MVEKFTSYDVGGELEELKYRRGRENLGNAAPAPPFHHPA